MRIIKFSINETAYDTFKSICHQNEITVKKKLNVLLSQDNISRDNISDYFPSNYNQNLRTITLKVNEELYKGIMKNSDKLGIRARRYIPYLIYRFIM